MLHQDCVIRIVVAQLQTIRIVVAQLQTPVKEMLRQDSVIRIVVAQPVRMLSAVSDTSERDIATGLCHKNSGFSTHKNAFLCFRHHYRVKEMSWLDSVVRFVVAQPIRMLSSVSDTSERDVAVGLLS